MDLETTEERRARVTLEGCIRMARVAGSVEPKGKAGRDRRDSALVRLAELEAMYAAKYGSRS